MPSCRTQQKFLWRSTLQLAIGLGACVCRDKALVEYRRLCGPVQAMTMEI